MGWHVQEFKRFFLDGDFFCFLFCVADKKGNRTACGRSKLGLHGDEETRVRVRARVEKITLVMCIVNRETLIRTSSFPAETAGSR
jgi:hypothetical protein